MYKRFGDNLVYFGHGNYNTLMNHLNNDYMDLIE